MAKLTKRSAAVAAGIAVVVIGGGAAFAANGWTIGGTGTAEANAAKITPLTATATVAGNIFPGKTTTISTAITNPNEFKVKLVGTIEPTNAVVTPADNDCLNGLGAQGVFVTNFPGTPEVAAGAKGQVVSSNLTVGDLPQACAGKKITISYKFDSVSQA